MKCNLGQVEKTVRTLLGVPLTATGFYVQNYSYPAGQVLLWLGMGLLVTAAFAWCPGTWVIKTITSKEPSNP